MTLDPTTRVIRWFRHPRTLETTALRFHGPEGRVSRPERAGLDVGAHVFVRGASPHTCQRAWREAEYALTAEGFDVVGTAVLLRSDALGWVAVPAEAGAR